MLALSFIGQPEGLPPLQRSPPAGPERWPDGQRLPRWPAAATAAGAPPPPPGALLGCVSGALGLTELVTEVLSAEYVTTCDPAEADAALGGAEVVMSQPFWPLYLDRARLEAAENLKLVITAGVGSDHIDLAACRELGVDVVEITQSNSSSVAEHAVMQALGLVRNYIPSNREVHRVWGQALPDPASARLQPSSVAPGWDIAACASRSYDVMGLNVGTVGCGRIARGILDRLSPFDVANFMYTEQARLPPVKEHQLGLGKGAHYFEEVADMLPHCDLVFINCPLTAQTDGLFSADLIAKMKRGAYLVNTARGRVCDQDAVVEALRSGQLGGYAGDGACGALIMTDKPVMTDLTEESMSERLSLAADIGDLRFSMVPAARSRRSSLARPQPAHRHDAAHQRHVARRAAPLRVGRGGGPVGVLQGRKGLARVLQRRPRRQARRSRRRVVHGRGAGPRRAEVTAMALTYH